MGKRRIKTFSLVFLFFIAGSFALLFGQTTQIRGFADVLTGIQNGKTTFSLGEQDLFITSELSDRFSFLGESVFKYNAASGTKFAVSVERIVIKYNIAGNHNLLVGKHHTPINYWNDTYHHGRVLFPTIYRPLLFDANIIPLHTTGVSFQGHNLGDVKFGYDLMVGNGIGSSDILDNDKRKSVTAAMHIKPAEGFRFGLSWYNDVIAKGATAHEVVQRWEVKQNLYSGSASYFGQKFEILTEGTIGFNNTDTTGKKQTIAWYLYGGYKITDKIVPYIRFDQLHFQEGEVFYHKDNATSIVGGIRFNINYLTAVKLEYQYQHLELEGDLNKFTAQLAIGF